MITRSDLRKLAGTDAGVERILSVQLDRSPVRQIQRDDIVVFDGLVRRAEGALDSETATALQREAARVHQFLVDEPPVGLGLVIYACEPIGLWQVYHLPRTLPDRVVFERRPRIRPIVDLLDEGERTLIVLVDSEHARVLVLNQEQIEDFWSQKSLVPGHHQQGGWSQANFQRHHDQVVDRHLRAVVRELTEIDQREPFSRLVVAGPVEPLNRLLRLMPDDLRDRVSGRVPGEMFQSDAELIQASLDEFRAAERRDEQRIVADVFETASGGGSAVCGLDAVLSEVLNGAIHQLVVANGMRIEGGVCPACGRLLTAADDRCPVCGAIVEPIDDIIDEAIRRTIMSDGDVEIVHGPGAADLLSRCRGLAAQLRFKTSPLTPLSRSS